MARREPGWAGSLMGQLWSCWLDALPSPGKVGIVNKTAAGAGVFGQMTEGSWLRFAGVIPSHLPSTVLLCSPEKCQRRMGEIPISKKAVPLPRGDQRPRAVLPISTALVWTERGSSTVVFGYKFPSHWKIKCIFSPWRRGAILMKSPLPPLQGSNPRSGFHCEVRKRTSPSNDTFLCPSKPAPCTSAQSSRVLNQD